MRVEIGFGIGFTKVGKPVPAVEANLASIVYDASVLFGGCNLLRGQGGWKPNGLPVVVEPSATLVINSAFTADDWEGQTFLTRVQAFAAVVRDRLYQDSVVVTVLEADFMFV